MAEGIIPFRTYKQLLPPEIIARLTRESCYLFSAVWNKAQLKGVGQIMMSDAEVARRALIRPRQLRDAQTALVSAGLMEIFRPLIDTVDSQMVYRFL